MTAKQALRDLVEDLSEEEAAELIEKLRVNGTIRFTPMTAEQRASLERGMAQTDAGLGVPHNEVLRRLGRA